MQQRIKGLNKIVLETWYGGLIFWLIIAVIILSILLLIEPVIILLTLIFSILNYVKNPKPKTQNQKASSENDCKECGAKAGERGYVSRHKAGCSFNKKKEETKT